MLRGSSHRIDRSLVPTHLTLSRFSFPSTRKDNIAIRYMWPAIVSGSGIFRFTHPVLFICWRQEQGCAIARIVLSSIYFFKYGFLNTRHYRCYVRGSKGWSKASKERHWRLFWSYFDISISNITLRVYLFACILYRSELPLPITYQNTNIRRIDRIETTRKGEREGKGFPRFQSIKARKELCNRELQNRFLSRWTTLPYVRNRLGQTSTRATSDSLRQTNLALRDGN